MDIPSRSVDGNDVLAIYDAALWAVARAREGMGPSFIECKTYRWRGHHMGDQGDTYGYRDTEEIDLWMTMCPIDRFKNVLLEEELASEAEIAAIDERIREQIDDAVEIAKNAPFPAPAEVYEDVYA
jgi:pyruvate dehydrogenase E1 component alpha subunit